MIFNLFGFLGKSKAMAALEFELREAGLHPQLLDDSVKLTMLRLIPEGTGGRDPAIVRGAAELLVYCVLGPEDFAQETLRARPEEQEARLQRVLDYPDSLDAEIVLLALKAGVANPAIASRFEVDQD